MPTTTSNLSCLVFGHNFFKFESAKSQSLFVCKHCKTKAHLNKYGDFVLNDSSHSELQPLLQELFILNKTLV